MNIKIISAVMMVLIIILHVRADVCCKTSAINNYGIMLGKCHGVVQIYEKQHNDSLSNNTILPYYHDSKRYQVMEKSEEEIVLKVIRRYVEDPKGTFLVSTHVSKSNINDNLFLVHSSFAWCLPLKNKSALPKIVYSNDYETVLEKVNVNGADKLVPIDHKIKRMWVNMSHLVGDGFNRPSDSESELNRGESGEGGY